MASRPALLGDAAARAGDEEFWAAAGAQLPDSDEEESAEKRRQRRRRSAAPRREAELPADSSKRLSARIDHMLDTFLGAPIPKLGGQVKAAVMREAAGRMPRFNRMSGIQEWTNAVFLFVNVGGVPYNNVFLDGGRRMTWFAQPTQQEDTPVIRRLLACTPDALARSGDDAVLLFCRLPDEPYVFCGRLTYGEHDPRRRPIKFVWVLHDFERLDANQGGEFQRILHPDS